MGLSIEEKLRNAANEIRDVALEREAQLIVDAANALDDQYDDGVQAERERVLFLLGCWDGDDVEDLRHAISSGVEVEEIEREHATQQPEKGGEPQP